MVPSVHNPVTQKNPKSMTPTFNAAAIRRAIVNAALPPSFWRRTAPAADAAAIVSRSSRAADTGTGAAIAPAPEVFDVDAGFTPGPVGTPEEPPLPVPAPAPPPL